jgi:hypothetical protein
MYIHTLNKGFSKICPAGRRLQLFANPTPSGLVVTTLGVKMMGFNPPLSEQKINAAHPPQTKNSRKALNHLIIQW